MINNTRINKMSFSVKKIKDVNLSSVMYETPSKVNSYYQSKIEYQMNGKMKPLMIQTPHCLSLSDFSEDKKYLTIELEITPELYDFFITLDEQNAEKAFLNSSSWFKQEIPKDIIDDYYKPSVKPVRENATPKLRVKIPYYNGDCQTKIYDNRKNTIGLKDIPVGSNILLILHINAIRFLKQNFYTDTYVTQIKVCYKKDDFTIPNVCIVEDDAPENEFNVEDLIDPENIPIEESLEPEEKLEESEESTVQESAVQESAVQEPVIKDPIVEEPIVEEPIVEEPIVEEPVVELEENIETQEPEIIQMEEVKSREDLKKEKIRKKLEESKKEFQYACNIFKQAEELVEIKNNRIKELEEKLNKLN